MRRQLVSIWNIDEVSAEFDRLRGLGLIYEHVAKSMSRKFGWTITKNMLIGRAWRLRRAVLTTDTTQRMICANRSGKLSASSGIE